jgi:hypothetical protein
MTSSISSVGQAGLTHNNTERRGAERAPADLRATLRFDDRLQVVQGTMCDVSVTGSGLICQVAVAQHSKCSLHFELPALGQLRAQAVHIPVTVVCCMQTVGQHYQFRVNLRFASLAAPVRLHIAAYVQHALGRAR